MKRTDLFKEMTALIDYIEVHIEEPLPLEHLAELVSISKFHLTRLFKMMCNKTLVSYVKSRKLAHSLDALINSNEKIIDMALRLGFDYEQSFIRAFKSEFGITPHQYRLSDNAVEYTKKLKFEDIVCIENGFWLVPTIEKLKPFRIVGNSIQLTKSNVHTVWSQAILEFWQKNCVHRQPLPRDCWGLTFKNRNDMDSFTFAIALHEKVFTENNLPIPSDYGTFSITATDFAVFKYIGHHGIEELTALRLERFNESLINTWLNALGYSCRSPLRMVIDRIPTAYVSENYCELHVYVPIPKEETPYLTKNI